VSNRIPCRPLATLAVDLSASWDRYDRLRPEDRDLVNRGRLLPVEETRELVRKALAGELADAVTEDRNRRKACRAAEQAAA
jgi:hypothetical protein